MAKVMFLDESGNHGLLTIDPLYPIFVLGGVIVDEDYAAGELTERVRQFKRDLFGRDDLILHTADVARNKNGFERLIEPVFRKRFHDELNQLMRALDYKVVACVIKKDAHLAAYGFSAIDPYMLSLGVLIERFCFELADAGETGVVVAEMRSPVLDRELDVAWLSLKIRGAEFVQANDLNRLVTGLVSRPKQANLAGLQLADLVVTPIGRHVLGKADHEDWVIVESKLRQRWGSYEEEGLVVLPKK